MSLLTLSGVEASYGASQALFGVDLALAQGEVLALMGRNGMGKTTTIKTICRLLPYGAGEIRFDGTDLRLLPPHRAARLGIGLVPEGRRCFGPLTVRENLVAAARPGPWDWSAVAALFPRLASRAQQRAAALSGGEQQMLAIGRAQGRDRPRHPGGRQVAGRVARRRRPRGDPRARPQRLARRLRRAHARDHDTLSGGLNRR